MWPFSTPAPSHAQWRWGTLTKLLTYFVRRSAAIRSSWSRRRFQGDISDDGFTVQCKDTKTKTTLNLEIVDSTIKDPWFWMYLMMVQSLHAVSDQSRSWCESCECHVMHFDSYSACNWLTDEESQEYISLVKQFPEFNGMLLDRSARNIE